jgi:PAS domain S-box-containing protein
MATMGFKPPFVGVMRAAGIVAVTIPLLVVLPGPSAAEASPGPPPPPIVSAAEDDYPPFSMVTDDGRADGFAIELFEAALGAMGRTATFRVGSWPEVRSWLENREVQALPLVARNPEREHLFDFTVPYMSLHGAIVVRHDATDVDSLADLRGLDVAVMEGDSSHEFMLRKPRDLNLITVPSFDEGLRRLSAGEFDAVVIQRLVAVRLIDQLGLENLRIVSRPVDGFRQDFCFAVPEGDRDTLALLNEGLALVTADGTHRRLHAKWFARLQLPPERRIIVGGDHDAPPFEYLDAEGHPAGYTVDLVRAVARTTGLDVDIHLEPWSAARRRLENGSVDVLAGILFTTERDRVFDFTPPHMAVNYVGVVRPDSLPVPRSLDDLGTASVVVQEGDIVHDAIVDAGAAIRLTTVADQTEALRRLSDGDHDVAVVSRVIALEWLANNPNRRLQVGTEPLLSPEYCMAVPEGHDALLATLTEGLQLIKESGEYREIRDRWMGVYEPEQPTLAEALRRAAIVLAALTAIVLMALGWSWLLRRQVAHRTADLQSSEERFRRAVEDAPVPIMIHAEDGSVLALSHTWSEITGYEPSSLRTLDEWTRLAYGDRAPEIRRIIDRLYDMTGPAREGEFEIRCRDDSTRIWEFSSTPLGRLSDGRLSAISMATDVTERRQAERVLAERERQTTELLMNLDAGVVVHAPDRRITFSNRAAQRMLDLTQDEMKGRTDRDDAWQFLRDDGSPMPVDEYPVNLVIASRRPLEQYVLGIRRPELPLPRWFLVNAFPEIDDGVLQQVVVTFSDVTERRQLEDRLRQAARLESVGRLAGGVAHDFNNMLMVIINRAEIALSALPDDHPAARDLREILTAGERSADVTRQLLGFARKQTIAPRYLDLNQVVEQLLTILRRLIGEDLQLEWHPHPETLGVTMDPVQVEQVLTNLCVNARDATDGSGTIVIETSTAFFDASQPLENPGFRPGRFACLSVRDEGCGMDPETLANAFEPFFTTKGVGEGSGLGLATVYGIAQQNSGFVHATSTLGQGTTIHVYLPRSAEPDRASGSAAAEVEDAPDTTTILLVEDDPAILNVLRETLEALGHRVVAARNPDQALAVSDHEGAGLHLVLTDVMMPEMRGDELVRRLTARFPDVRVLYMSGFGTDDLADQGVLNGDIHFLQKPFTSARLAEAIREALEDRVN